MNTAKRAAIALTLVVLVYLAGAAVLLPPMSALSVSEAITAISIGGGLALLALPVIRERTVTPSRVAMAALLMLGGIAFGMTSPFLGYVIQPEIHSATPAPNTDE